MEGESTTHISELIKKTVLKLEETANKYMAADLTSEADIYMEEFKRLKIIHEGLEDINEKRNKTS